MLRSGCKLMVVKYRGVSFSVRLMLGEVYIKSVRLFESLHPVAILWVS